MKTDEQLEAEWWDRKIANMAITRDEFLLRFKAHMIERAGATFDDGTSIAEYADDTGPTYYDDPGQREEGPEACAEADMSCWGD